MSDTIELMDEQGNKVEVPKAEYASQIMAFARGHWDNLDALRNLQIQLMQAGLPAEALDPANRACELSQQHVNDLYWRAASLAALGRHDEAAEAFAELQDDAAYPQDQARAAVGLARVKSLQNKREEAEQLLDWAIETDPNNPGPLHSLFQYWNEQGAADKAVEKIESIAAAQPGNPAPYRVLAHIALQTKDAEGVLKNSKLAIERATTAEQIDETVAEMSYLLGSAGMAQEIVNIIEPRRLTIRNPQSFLNLAQAYVDLDRKPEARAMIKQLIDGAPPEMRGMLEQRLNQIA